MILGGHRSAFSDGAFAGTVTLDQIVRKLAASKGDALAILDPTDRPAFTDGGPRRLTWGQLDERADMLARCLAGLGLTRDNVVAIQLPNTVEQAVALIGVLRAGLVAALLPLAWREREITWALGRVNAKAAITCVRAGPVQHASIIMNAAVENFGLRFVCAFGRGVPDGVMSLDEALQTGGWPEPEAEERPGNPASHVALITFDATRDGFVPVARSHNGIITAGLGHLTETKLNAGDTIATTLLPTSLAGLVTGFVSSMLSGAPLLLHQPFSSSVLSGAIVTSGASHVVLPGVVADALAGSRLPNPPLKGISAVRRDPCLAPAPTLSRISVTECFALGEIGLFMGPASEYEAGFLAGKIHAPRSGAGATFLIETRCGEDGAFQVRGPLAPVAELPGFQPSDARLIFDKESWVSTGWRGVPKGDHVLITEDRAGVTLVGGMSLPTGPTLEAVRTVLDCAPDDIRFISDPAFGARLSVRPSAARNPAGLLKEAGFTAALLPAGAKAATSSHAEVA